MWLYLYHCCYLLVPPTANLPSLWESLSCSCKAWRMEEKTPRTSHKGLTVQEVCLETCLCVFLQILHFGAAHSNVSVQNCRWLRKKSLPHV